jgi:hypothetical protein
MRWGTLIRPLKEVLSGSQQRLHGLEQLAMGLLPVESAATGFQSR